MIFKIIRENDEWKKDNINKLSINTSVNLMAIRNLLFIYIRDAHVCLHVSYGQAHNYKFSLILILILSLSLFPPLFLSTFILSVAVLRGSEYLVHYIDYVTRSAIKSQTMCMIR